MSDCSSDFSPTLGALAKALAAAQSELGDAKKDAVNPAFKRGNEVSKYASLASVREAVTKTFSKHGLSVVQPFEPHGADGICIVTMLLHESGEWIKSRLYLPVTKKDPQGFGSAISYGRRYALAAIANIATDDDDDGNEASKPAPAKAGDKPAPVEAKGPPATASVDVDALAKALEEANDTTALAKASMAVGNAKSKLTPPQLERLRGLLASRTRQLAEADEKGKAA